MTDQSVCTWPTGRPGKCTLPPEWRVSVHYPDTVEREMILCDDHARIGWKSAKGFGVNKNVTFSEIESDPGDRDKRIMRSEKKPLEERKEAFRRHNRRTSSP